MKYKIKLNPETVGWEIFIKEGIFGSWKVIDTVS